MNYDIIPMTADHLDDVAEIERRCFSDNVPAPLRDLEHDDTRVVLGSPFHHELPFLHPAGEPRRVGGSAR